MDHVSQLKREKTGMLATSSPFWLETSDENFTTIINSVDIVRHNFSHIHTKHREKTLELINKIRSVDPNKRMLWDLQGPEMRTLDNYENRLIELVPETTVQLALGIEGKDENIATHLYINTSDFFQGLEVGHKVLMDDGKALLTISEVVDEFIVNAKVVHGGAIKSRRGVNIRGKVIGLPDLSQKDYADLQEFILPNMQEGDILAHSYTRNPEVLNEIRELSGGKMAIMPKIETQQAVEDDVLPKIVAASDMPLVARGDGRCEIGEEAIDMPLFTQKIVDECKKQGKPVVIATGMLESLFEQPEPSNAECEGLYRHIHDQQVDYLWYSGETALNVDVALRTIYSHHAAVKKYSR